ncbi:hypothetical protein BASA50_004087 [Batrachochytrium salamandrivorans]|uniref:Uncharacterized protein n=1 Tax=Batrachochytrium salamandrivorans TaxID=1357716 RepID=A0ABQ8FGI6_9FUNG|nr:hypothetical protein BASA50_004087 [Batrachochytrium salamandrivorans]
MKLQGVFMITPLLAVVASGITIPSTDGHNVQQLEKRSDNDPVVRGPDSKNLRVRFASGSGGNEDDQSKTSGRHSEGAGQQTQNPAELPDETDDNKNQKSVGPSNLRQNPRMRQHSAANYGGTKLVGPPSRFGETGRQDSTTDKDKKKKPPKSSKSGCGFRHFFTCKRS